jgi:hypothetical protein
MSEGHCKKYKEKGNMNDRKKVEGLPDILPDKLKLLLVQMPQPLNANDGFDIVFDTGTTVPVSFDKNDFTELRKPKTPMQMKGIAKGLQVEGVGMINWHVSSDDGSL